ncbi:ABC transporter permease [Pilimelia columellifera]|uniref:ABC transporter permease n=1 Tax=Pilimelia columellifera subsp. columellifera TaxID=706583 RepID=A0ABP6AWW6_9ACTN
MSVAEAARPAAVRPAPAPARAVSTRLLRSELRLIFGRRRNWVGMAVLATVPLIIAIAAKASPSATDGPDFFSGITQNGLFVALAALTIEIPLFLPLAVAAIAADSVAGEAQLGTLRYQLVVPVGRTRMLAVKFAAIAIFAAAATAWVAFVGVVAGLILFGGGEMTLLSGAQVSMAEGALRLLGVCAYLAVCLVALGAVGLFVSTLTEQPIGATIAVLLVHVASLILGTIPQLDWLQPYLLNVHWLAFGSLMMDPVATEPLQDGLLSAGAYTLIFVTAAWARFAGRDVTS